MIFRAAVIFLLLSVCAASAQTDMEIFLRDGGGYRMGATFAEPTTRYDHGILGDAIEHGSLVVGLEHEEARFDLPQNRVFEDTAPRLADIGGSKDPEIIVVETDIRLGAQLSIYRASFSPIWAPKLEKIAATPHIGQTHRWLAPAGIADFDGDGQNDIAYIETPHLGKVLRIVTLRGGKLVEIAAASGLSNHRIGDGYISGGVRDCGSGPELVLANADWTRLVAVSLVDGLVKGEDIGILTGRENFTTALHC